MIGDARAHRRAFTLVELLVSMTVMVVLMGGVASALVLASRALPAETSPVQSQIMAYEAVEGLMAEVYTAQTFTVRSETVVEFTVADRDGDKTAETIRYAWSGVPGDPLTRKYNSAAATNVVENVHSFDLSYVVDSVGSTVIEEGVTESDEVLLATFDGWAGVTGTSVQYQVSNSAWVSEYFEIVPEPTANELVFTRGEVRLATTGGPAPASVTLGIHRSLGDGSFQPSAMSIGTPGSILGTTLSPTSDWHSADFSGASVTDLGRTDYCLVLKASDTVFALAESLYNKSAPTDGGVQLWTTDAGANWDPRARLQDQQDLRFKLWGIYRITGTVEVTTYRYFLCTVTALLQVGTVASAGVETSVQVLNMPEVTGP